LTKGGILIVEGARCSGKTSVLNLVRSQLTEHGFFVVQHVAPRWSSFELNVRKEERTDPELRRMFFDITVAEEVRTASEVATQGGFYLFDRMVISDMACRRWSYDYCIRKFLLDFVVPSGISFVVAVLGVTQQAYNERFTLREKCTPPCVDIPAENTALWESATAFHKTVRLSRPGLEVVTLLLDSTKHTPDVLSNVLSRALRGKNLSKEVLSGEVTFNLH